MTCFKLIPALLLTLSACVLDKDLGDTPDTTTTAPAPTTGATDHGETTNPTEPGTTDPTATTAAPAQLCPDSDDNFSCTVPPTPSSDCPNSQCGSLRDSFDVDGCPRARCHVDGKCPAGRVCFDTDDWGTCNSSGVDCSDYEGVCECGFTTDCNSVAYCVPIEVGPPADCFAITDAAECLAAGCSEAPTVIPVTVDGDTCVCGEPETACLWFPQGIGGVEASPGAFFNRASGRVVVFPSTYTDSPLGWVNCEDYSDEPACDCAKTCGAL